MDLDGLRWAAPSGVTRRHPSGRREIGWVSDDHPVPDGSRAIFVHGFAKSEQDNIRDDELAAFKLLAAHLLAYDDAAIATAVAAGVLMEVMGDD